MSAKWAVGQQVAVAGAFSGQLQRAEIVRLDGFRARIRYLNTGREVEVAKSRLRMINPAGAS